MTDDLVDHFLTQCADPSWWTQTIAFTASRRPGGYSNELTSSGTSTACCFNAANGTTASTASLVAASTTGAATPSL